MILRSLENLLKLYIGKLGSPNSDLSIPKVSFSNSTKSAIERIQLKHRWRAIIHIKLGEEFERKVLPLPPKKPIVAECASDLFFFENCLILG